MKDMYKNFVAALEDLSIQVDDKQLSLVEKGTVAKVWTNTLDFLEDRNLTPGENRGGLEAFDKPLVSINGNTTLEHVGVEAIVQFCEQCEIPREQQFSAACCIAHILTNEQSAAVHFDSGRSGIESMGDKIQFKDFNSVFGANASAMITHQATAALEAFGQDIDKMVNDVKVNIAITMLKFHKNIIDRVMFRKPCDSNIVQFAVPYNEVYDLAESTNQTSAVRNQGAHRVPFIDLYHRPEIANTEAKKIIPLKANDTGATPLLVADSKIVFGKDVNLFDLALDATKFGHSHVDYTDIVADGVLFDSAVLEVTLDDGTNPAVAELFELPLRIRSGARFQLRNNSRDSADRNCVIGEKLLFDAETKKVDGTANTVLAAFTGDAGLLLKVDIDGRINLKTADTFAQGQVTGSVVTESGEAPIAAVTDAFADLTFALKYYTLDARYSEENMRKTTSAVRMSMRPMAYEIPVGKNYVVDYSLAQVKPTDVLGTISQAIAIGNDIRALRLMKDTMDLVYDRLKAEASRTMFTNYQDRVAFDFVAGMKVLPYIFRGEIDIAEVESLRTSDILGDIRTLVEKKMLEIFSLIYNQSLYLQALNNGEKPHFKVITSGPIMSTCFAIPHIHNHLNIEQAVDGESVEYARVLPDGTRLDVITTTFNEFIDKIIIIPYRKNDPTSELNFGVNCDRGQFVANFTPTISHGVHRRIAVNSREIIYPTNPIGCYIEVKNISSYFDQLGNLDVVTP
jgi:hypothetical protein